MSDPDNREGFGSINNEAVITDSLRLVDAERSQKGSYYMRFLRNTGKQLITWLLEILSFIKKFLRIIDRRLSRPWHKTGWLKTVPLVCSLKQPDLGK